MYSDYCPLTDLDNLTSTLDAHGVAVLPNVFGEEECETFKQKILKYLNDEMSIKEPNEFAKLRPIKGGLLHYYGISLLKEVLDLKTDDRVIEPFKRIWKEENLTTSLDGIFIGPPAEKCTAQLFFDPKQTSFHTDQASDKQEMCCIQAFINVEHTQTGDGCLSVLTNSHKYFNEFFQHFNISTHGKDWYLIKPQHFDWFIQKGCEWKMIMAPKGSMVFWDSRTIHMGTLSRRDRPNPERWRFLVYVCYTPARLETMQDVKLKREAYIQNRCTSHWPYGVRLFNRRDDDLKFNDLKTLTVRHRKLIGI